MSEATIEVRARLTADQIGFQKGMEQAAQATQQLANASAKLQRSMVALGAVSAIATGAIIAFGVKSFNAAARVDELDVAMNAVGKSTGLGYQALQDTALAVKGMGIEMDIAQKAALTFAQNNLKLSYASELARAAQDLAVISGQNSTDTFNRLTYAVITGRSEVLKTVGIQKSAGQMYESYAKSINKSAKELTFQEKQQAVATGALAEAAKVAGTYEAAMQTPGKVLRSFARVINEIQVAIGKSLLTGFGPLIYSAYEMVKSFSAALEKTRTFQTVIKATGMVLEKLTAPFTRLFEKIKEFVDSFALGEFADDMVKAQTGMSIVRTTIKDLASQIEFILPPIAALLAGFSAFAGARVFAMVPGLGAILKLLKPLPVALVVLAVTSTQVREALGRLGAVIKPLLTPFAGLAKIFTGSLGYATSLLAKGIDGVTKVISTAIGFVQRYSNIFKVIGAVILTLLVVLAAAKIALLAQALVLSIASAAASKFAAVQGFLNSVMALNPIALVVIALIGLVTAIVIAYKSSEAFAETFRNAFNSVATVVGQVLGFVFRLFGNLLLGYGELMSTNTAFGHLVANVFQFVYQSITFTITFILKVFAFFIDGFVRLMETNQTFARIVQDVFNVVARIISGAVNFILTVLATFIKIIAAVIWGVSQMKDVVVSVVKGVIAAFRLFGEKVGIIFEVITGGISKFTNFVRDKISTFIEMLARAAQKLPDFLGGNKVEEALIKFNVAIKGSSDTVKEFDETLSRSKLDKVTADTKKATDAFSSVGIAINNFMQKGLNFTSGVSGALSDVANTLLKSRSRRSKVYSTRLG
jgi:phage-related protein